MPSTTAKRNHDRILVVGATGSIGRQVVAQAIESGHRVRALARSLQRVTVLDPRCEVMIGDVTD